MPCFILLQPPVTNFFLFQRSQLIYGAYETKAVFKASIMKQLTILFLHAPNAFKDRGREDTT